MKNLNPVLLLIVSLTLLSCASANPIDPPKNREELDLWIEAEEFVRYEDNKAKTLWMYSTGSFALFALGLAVTAFFSSRRLSGLALMAGGAIGMASVWVFEAEWFPWVAGVTLGLVLLSALAFAWVNAYHAYVANQQPTSPPSKSLE